jgi:hypothetical protein
MECMCEIFKLSIELVRSYLIACETKIYFVRRIHVEILFAAFTWSIYRSQRIQILNSYTSHSGLEELHELLSDTIPLGHKNSAELAEAYSETAATGYGGKMYFAEFLLLMRRLLDRNFAGIASLRSASGSSQEA